MSTTSKSLVLLSSLGTGIQVWNGEKGRLMSSTPYLAKKFGLTVGAVEAHRDTMPLVKNKKTGEMVKPSLARACKDLVLVGLTEGTDEYKAKEKEIRAVYKEFDQHRDAAYSDMNKVNAVLAADPTLKKDVKVVRNRKGEVIGANTSYRRDRRNKESQIQQLQAQVAALATQLAAAQLAIPAGQPSAI